MQQAHSGRLELTWTNKEKTLLASEDGSYEWVDSADYRVAEVRLLTDVLTVGETEPDDRRARDNLLIRGDALHVLQALNRVPEFADEYVGKVRLVYIDPPFNTGQAFTQYDDNLEHSVWLTMLRDRLAQIKPLLTVNGSVWIHLDDSEVHRCRVVLDEVFGIDSFVATIVWQKRYSRSNDATFSVSQDYLLVYGQRPNAFASNRLRRGSDLQYSNPDNDPRGVWRGIPWDAPEERNGLDYPILTPTGDVKRPPRGRHWSGTEANWRSVVAEGRDYYGKNESGMPNVKKYLSEMPGLVPHTLWTHEEVGHNDAAKKEIKALFPGIDAFATPKPERLLSRVIQIGTEPGDIVLDCFVGSGTSAAVAHKMGRRWVAVESSPETIATYTLPRLTKVVAGEDPGGVTTVETPIGEGLPDGVRPGAGKGAAATVAAMMNAGLLDDIDGIDAGAVRALAKAMRDADKVTIETVWKGGGGFRVLDVGPSMFEAIGGRVYLAKWAVNGALAEAIAAQYGFAYEPDPPFSGTKGKTRLAVVDGLVNEEVVRLLVDSLLDGQQIAVCGTQIDPAVRPVLRQLRPGSTLKKVPAALLDEYRQSCRERLLMANVLDWAEAAILLDDAVEEAKNQMGGSR